MDLQSLGMDAQSIGIAAALGAGAAWAIGAVLFKGLADRVPPLGLTFAKGILGLVFLGGLLLLDESPPVDANTSLLLGLSGLLGITLGDTFFFATLRTWPAHLVVLLSLAGQALVVLLAVLFLAETPSRTAVAGMVLIIIGISFAVIRRADAPGTRLSRRGWVFGLLSIATMSSSVLVAKVGLHEASALQATFIRLLCGTAGSLVLGAISGGARNWLEPFREYKMRRDLVAAVLVGTVGGLWLFHLGLKNVDASIANTLTATEPLLVLPLAAVVLGERVQRNAILGTVIAVAGVGLLYLNIR